MTPRAPAARARPAKRADARRNEQALLDAAAAVFVRSGVDAPVREIAVEAGVGVGTIYRHFPTRADLVVAVFRHQLDALSSLEAIVPAPDENPYAALRSWVHRFADFLVTKHGLARALRSDQAGFDTLHAEFLERLLPVCDRMLKAAVAKGLPRGDVRTLDFLHGVGNLCIGVEADPEYDVHGMIDLFIAGLAQPLIDQ
ncbi:TetR/AcrR family transcriptional regulator [Mycobacterium simiae]|uniref:TetR/AcrR family transcriptional regulator n=1 Tax=Mycobacterium simiae TaxID=1784 RepID=UPI00041FD798|nr:TetR/AcrR family transcriptional regulator [Mycobacterium simiae]PLV45732.1 TetR family transcriptional regulator [Mycobacterium tuberculosis variant microti OV254]BBX43447.1 TetR family transcriptional regulator [Mycobacterium simiae]